MCDVQACVQKIADREKAIKKLEAFPKDPTCRDIEHNIAQELEDLTELRHKLVKASKYKKASSYKLWKSYVV